MSVFFVNQGKTAEHEYVGKYVWAPQKNKVGNDNPGFYTMNEIRKGDFIIHNRKSKIYAISIAQNDCYVADQPSELYSASNNSWNDDGYRVDCEYFVLDNPLNIKVARPWFESHYNEDSAFNVKGGCKQQYMCHISDDHAIYLLEKALEIQGNRITKGVLQSALEDILGEKDSEYDQLEQDRINELVEESDEEDRPEWPGIRESQAMTQSVGTDKPKPKRDPKRAADALARAEYKCEFNQEDKTFLRKNGKHYTEPHHLIPISKYKDFHGNSVDVMENIVSLCSHCHNLLHYGRLEDKKPILEKLYEERKEALHICGLDITLDQLFDYYK